MTRNPMSDQELDRLLTMASDPAPPSGAEERTMARLAPSNVVAFKLKQAPSRSAISWLAALPLAASLAFGLWLGVVGVGVELLPLGLGGDAVATADDGAFSGIDDVEVLSEDSQT